MKREWNFTRIVKKLKGCWFRAHLLYNLQLQFTVHFLTCHAFHLERRVLRDNVVAARSGAGTLSPIWIISLYHNNGWFSFSRDYARFWNLKGLRQLSPFLDKLKQFTFSRREQTKREKPKTAYKNLRFHQAKSMRFIFFYSFFFIQDLFRKHRTVFFLGNVRLRLSVFFVRSILPTHT